MQFKHNRTVVEFENRGDKVCELFKDRPIGILDLRSIGYYNVSYQRLIAMAEEKFELFHYMKKLPTKSDERQNGTIVCPVSHTEKDMYIIQILTHG